MIFIVITISNLMLINMFEEFYSKYPRKEAGKDARKAWGQIGPKGQVKALEAIDAHAARWLALGTSKEFIPLPASWLRGERYEDEIEMPKPSKMPEKAWWTSNEGIASKGKELGMTPGVGETWPQFQQRITTKVRAK